MEPNLVGVITLGVLLTWLCLEIRKRNANIIKIVAISMLTFIGVPAMMWLTIYLS